MKKNILNEVNKIREMMGLINEQETGCTDGDCKNGVGYYVWPNGSRYEGDWKDGYMDGLGDYVSSNGNSYYGGWKDGKRDGKGTLTCKDGNGNWKEYEQTWEEGKLISGGSCDENSNNNTGSQGDNTFPENWKEGINNKGWVLMKGSHSHEGKIPDTKKAIEFIQTKVGLSGDDVDGLYGSNTAKKVWDYQENNELKPDGKVGKNTLSKMLT